MKNFPIVCVGGSIGGLDANVRLLKYLPADTGVAIVIVNHITIMPTQLHDVLPRFTTMPVELIEGCLQSGSGKSTLAKLMLGFYQPAEGSIKLDGVDIRNLSANELRSHFGVVPQETILFSGTILANLQAGSLGATLEQVTVAAKMAGIHYTIEQLPKGYQTELGERGVGLSGGQRQRMAIARSKAKVVPRQLN